MENECGNVVENNVCVCVCVYIYIYRERERERDVAEKSPDIRLCFKHQVSGGFAPPVYMNTYINKYIFIYLSICTGGCNLYYSSKPPAGGHNCILVSCPLKLQWLQ